MQDKRMWMLCALLFGGTIGVRGAEFDVSAMVAELEGGSVGDIAAWCARLIPPERRTEADDTRARTLLHALTMRAGPTGSLRRNLQVAYADQLYSERPAAVKAFILEMLQFVADPGALAAVTPFLTDKELCDRAARVVVNIGGAAAVDTLFGAYLEAEGSTRVRLVQAMGRLGTPGAVPELVQDAIGLDPDLRLAALTALAETDQPHGLPVLLAATRDPSPRIRRGADLAYLTLLRKRAVTPDREEAVQRALAFAADRPNTPHIQCAVLELCGRAGGKRATAAVLDGLLHPNLRVRLSAGRALRMLPGKALTRRLLEQLQQTPPGPRAEMLVLLAGLPAKGALPAIRRQIDADDPGVRRAAIGALAAVAGSGSLRDLVRLLDDEREGVSEAAVAAIVGMAGNDVGRTLCKLARRSSEPLRVALLGLLARRLEFARVDAVLRFARDRSPRVRRAALEALSTLAGAEDVPALVAHALRCSDARELKAAQAALIAVCRRDVRRELTGPAVVKPLAEAEPDKRAALLAVLPAVGGDLALRAARAALDASDPGVRRAAVRALSEWPDAAAMPWLAGIARDSRDRVHYVLAFRGYVRLVNQLQAPIDDKLAMYTKAMDLARRAEEKKLVLAGIGGTADRASFTALLTALGDPQVRPEAAAAAIELARTVRGADSVKALKRVLQAVGDDPLAERAKSALAEIAKFAGCVVTWELSGPYSDGGKTHTAIYPVVFPPETEEAGTVEWRRVSGGENGRIDLGKRIGGSNRCAYLRANLVLPETTKARIDVGSDDGVKVWLNGEVVHENNVPRAFTWCEDTFEAVLRKGLNTLMLKITQGGGGWEANARIRRADGTPIDGLNFAIGKPVRRIAP